MQKSKYQGVIPAFYACYDNKGNVSAERAKKLARHLVNKGVRGLYVGGSSGECIYQEKEERTEILEAVMSEVKGECTVIAHVACNNTHESCQLAAHAENLGVDAIASIPPLYFHLPEYAIAGYWNDISAAAPNTDFIIYNIPQLAGVALTPSLFREMKKIRESSVSKTLPCRPMILRFSTGKAAATLSSSTVRMSSLSRDVPSVLPAALAAHTRLCWSCS